MSLADVLAVARETNDWSLLVKAIPFAAFLGMQMDIKGEKLTCVLPAHERLVGNVGLAALHGGATLGFMECAAILFLLWHKDSTTLPKAIDFNIDYLRSGKVRDTYADMHLVKFGTRVANVRVAAWQSDPERPIAVGNGNFLLT